MSKAPFRCPMCGEMLKWKKIDSMNKGFSVGKAAAGAILLGPIGLVGGALEKREPCMHAETVDSVMNMIPTNTK